MTVVRGAGRMRVGAIQAPAAFADVGAMARINRDGLPVIAAEGEHRHERFDAMLECEGGDAICSSASDFAADSAAARDWTRWRRRSASPRTPQCFSTADSAGRFVALRRGARQCRQRRVPSLSRPSGGAAAGADAPRRRRRRSASTIRRDSDSGRSQQARNPAAAKSSRMRSSARS